MSGVANSRCFLISHLVSGSGNVCVIPKPVLRVLKCFTLFIYYEALFCKALKFACVCDGDGEVTAA